jgi:hypothetical protein
MSPRSRVRAPHGIKSNSEGHFARLAQLVERQTFNLVVVGSSPTVGTRVVDLKQLGL